MFFISTVHWHISVDDPPDGSIHSPQYIVLLGKAASEVLRAAVVRSARQHIFPLLMSGVRVVKTELLYPLISQDSVSTYIVFMTLGSDMFHQYLFVQ